MEWINNKVLLYSTGNYIQYLVINHNGKEYKKECIYVYNWVTLPYSRNEYNIVNQLYFNLRKIYKGISLNTQSCYLEINELQRVKTDDHILLSVQSYPQVKDNIKYLFCNLNSYPILDRLSWRQHYELNIIIIFSKLYYLWWFLILHI